jgi:hypothetical protein
MTPDEKANRIIKGMVAAGVTAGSVPVPALVPFMGAVAGGVVAIGACYGVELSKRDAWKLVYMSALVGSHFMVWLLTPTGLGTPLAVAIDAATCAAVAYAAGTAAQHYFKGQTSHDELRAVVRGAVAEARRNFTTIREPK